MHVLEYLHRNIKMTKKSEFSSFIERIEVHILNNKKIAFIRSDQSYITDNMVSFANALEKSLGIPVHFIPMKLEIKDYTVNS